MAIILVSQISHLFLYLANYGHKFKLHTVRLMYIHIAHMSCPKKSKRLLESTNTVPAYKATKSVCGPVILCMDRPRRMGCGIVFLILFCHNLFIIKIIKLASAAAAGQGVHCGLVDIKEIRENTSSLLSGADSAS